MLVHWPWPVLNPSFAKSDEFSKRVKRAREKRERYLETQREREREREKWREEGMLKGQTKRMTGRGERAILK